MSAPLLEIDDLHVHFPMRGGFLSRDRRVVHAVSGVSLTLNEGECLSIVGESGCGKSTTALTVMGLQEPTSGAVRFRGQPITGPGAPGRMARARIAQMVFQDPYASLNPRQTVYQSLAGPLRLHGRGSRAEIDARVAEIMRHVGLTPEQAGRYPHEFSGGQRQRIGIARALILDPELIVLDEPVSALDVSIRAQIINLLLDLQERLSLSYIMISHDLGVVEHMSDRVAVMYFGQIVEIGPWDAIFAKPTHPYTRKLISTIPDPDAILHKGAAEALPKAEPPPGYAFYPQNIERPDIYTPPEPSELIEIGAGHFVRCQPVGARAMMAGV
ncbi:MAG: ATP-binding cassette domain-containing protein [Paracoccus sp. (in: a-proteobacteria)]|nr:ATP-binding cassette domain-containing protein [Paracoccus sp. (in: a-proteobacteria)]